MFFPVPKRQDDVVCGSRSDEVPNVSCVKSSAKVMIWGAMGVNGLSKLHIVPSGKTINAKYKVDKILEKEPKPALNRQKNNTLTGLMNESWFNIQDTLRMFKMVQHLKLP